MPMLNLLYCSMNFRKTTGSFWNYYPDKPNSDMLVIMKGQECFIQLKIQKILIKKLNL